MLDPLAVAITAAAAFTVGGFALSRAGRYAGQANIILAAIATGLGMLVLIIGLGRLDARGPSLSPAEPRADWGMSWRPPARAPAN